MCNLYGSLASKSIELAPWMSSSWVPVVSVKDIVVDYVVSPEDMVDLEDMYMETRKSSHVQRCNDRSRKAMRRVSKLARLTKRPVTKYEIAPGSYVDVVSSAGLTDTDTLMAASRALDGVCTDRATSRTWKNTKVRKQWAKHLA